MRSLIVAVCALAGIMPAPAAAAPAAMPATAAKNSPDDDKIVCRSEARTGSHFSKKVCHSRAEWEALAESARRGASELIDAPKINSTTEH